MGEGHQQAKENRAAERKRKAEMRHKEALKVQKSRKETLMKQKTWHIKARKEALLVEKERSAKITNLPPPPPTLFENIEVKRITNVETNSSTYHHLYSFVNREMDTNQPDPHLAAEEEAKRLEELRKQAVQQRMQQCEKAHVRGFQAMKKIHLAQNQEKLMKELKQLQQEDLARRRQTVARMPPQLLELPYRRSEMKEDWQRELEFAFEDMYNADRKVKGNLILHLEPEPLPTVTDQIQDKELDLSMEQENLEETENIPVTEAKMICSSEADVPLAMKTHQVPSKILFKKLLNKIRSQKSLWTIKSTSEDESEMITTVSETESKAQTVESGATASEDRTLSEQEQVVESDMLTVDSGPLTSEPHSCDADSEKEQEINETQSLTTVAQSSVLLHPQEAAARIRMAARQRQIMEIEEQKQKQLELLEQIEQQKLRLETDCFRAQLEEEKKKETQQTVVGTAPASCTVSSDEDHRKMIRDYQHQLLQQNRLHRQSVETARKQLLDYQTMLKGKYSSMSATSLIPDSVLSQKSERPPVRLEHWDQGQRPKLSPDKHQPLQPIQISELEQDYFQVLKQNHFPQRQVETTEALITSDVLAKQSLESQEQLKQFSQTETQQRDYKLVPKDFHTLSRALPPDRPLILQDARGIPETSKATTSQTLGSQQMFSENRESISSEQTELSSFLPLAAERSFNFLPAKVQSGKIQEPFSASNKSTVSVISQIQDKSLPSSETVTVQQSNVKAPQEQLDLQKEVLRSRQEAQEQLLLCKQKELERQTGLSLFLPSVPLDSFALLPHAKSESGRIQDSSPTTNDSAVSSDHPGVSQLQDRLLSFSQPILAQQDNLKLLQEQLNIQRDNLQARREAQEVLYVHKQSELDGGVLSEQTEPPSLPSQVAKHTFISLSSAGTQSGEIQKQYLSKSEKEFLSSQSEIPKSHTGPSSFLQQLLPLHDSLKLLQEQLTAQTDALQARHKAQAELLLDRQRDLGHSKSGQMSSSLPPVFAQCAVDSQASAKTEPGRIQSTCFSERGHIIPSRHSVIPTLQYASLSLPPHSLPQQEKLVHLPEQSHIKRVMLGTEQATEEFVHKPSKLGKRISEQTGVSLSLSQVAESERFQKFMSVKSDSTVPLSHFKIPGFQQRLLRFSQHAQPQDNLEKHQERLDTEGEALPFSKKTRGSISSEQTGLSSFIPQLGKLSLTSLSFAESSTAQEPLSTESNSKIPASHLQIPQLQDRLLKISQLIQPQQDNLKVLQEQLATQREGIVQCRWDTQEELHKQNEWRERVSPEQVGTSSFLPLVVQHSFASLPPSESGRIQEPCSAKSDNTASSGHSEIPRLPNRLLGLSQPILPQQDMTALQQEHLNARTDSLPCHEKTQKELVLPRQHKLEEQLPSDRHFVQLCHSDLKALQQQLDTQRKAMGLRQEAQEEVLLQKLSKLEKRVSSEQVSSSSPLSWVQLPIADSERIPKAFPTGSNVPSSHPEVCGSQDGRLSSSQPVLPQRDHMTTELAIQREAAHSAEKAQEELLLDKQSELIESKSDHAVSFLSFLPKETEHAFIPLPFAEVKSGNTCELYSSKNEHIGPSSDSAIPRFQGTLLSFSPVLAQQDNVKLQKQLDLQKEVLRYSQKVQEKLLVQRKTALQRHIQKHQETVKDFFKGSQTNKPTVENDFTQKHREWLPHFQHLARDDQENISPADWSNSDDNQLLSEDSSAKQSGEHLDEELGRRSSKPPVAKVKCGLDLNQHELSAIQEVESPAGGKISLLGKPDFYQDRDPLRISVSREQSFLGSPLDCDPFGYVHLYAQENASGIDSEEAVTVKEVVVENHAGLSYAVEEEQHTYPDPAVEPDNVETQEIYHEPLSSVTVSTGSLSYENTDGSLTDPVDLDFPELEHTFPDLHHHLFKPLEPHPDFDLSSSSGIPQDSRAFYQSPDSSCENHCATVPSKSTVSFTSLQTSLLSSIYTGLTQPPDPNFADTIAPSFATENFEGSEQSFRQLLPEFSSQESQHADLSSIFNIEVRDRSEGMENHNYSEQTEILQNKKNAHFQLSIGNLQSSVFISSDEANVFHPVNLQYSTPCGSDASEFSIKDQLEGKKERSGFEELTENGIDALHQGLNAKNESCGVLNINPHAKEIDPQLCIRTVECSLQNENFEDSAKAETPKINGNLSQLAQSEVFLSSGSLSLQSCIPVWETESGYGIMEEPELTLVSTSDISTAETNFANLTLEEKGQYEPSNCI
ncbi:hypothetical protein MC885_007393, partial [Smutsia gigantea]